MYEAQKIFSFYFLYSRLWTAGLHESAAGDTPIDWKLGILKYFFTLLPWKKTKSSLKASSETLQHVQARLLHNGFSKYCYFDFSLKFSYCQQYYFPRQQVLVKKFF